MERIRKLLAQLVCAHARTTILYRSLFVFLPFSTNTSSKQLISSLSWVGFYWQLFVTKKHSHKCVTCTYKWNQYLFKMYKNLEAFVFNFVSALVFVTFLDKVNWTTGKYCDCVSPISFSCFAWFSTGELLYASLSSWPE